ncbi:MAG: hypothetical protein L6Q84_24400 [Polyangiaceae bacterium]|nr:hypothetical protein [Polyangiaceae bacterium]
MPAPSQNPDLYNSIVLNGLRSPGVVTLSGHDREHGWDIKEAKGQDGASTTRNGEKVCQFTATFQLSDDPLSDVDDYATWDSFRTMLQLSMRAKAPTAMPIFHPDLAAQNITSVCVASVGGVQHDGRGGATVAVKLLEYRPPKKKPVGKPSSKAAKNPAAAVGEAANQQLLNALKAGPTPNAQAQATLDDLKKEAEKP